jgi:hypothetical protein
MNAIQKGIILGILQCVLCLSLTGKLLYDRATCPRVWVKTVPWDPALPVRGRYLALQLRPEPGAAHFDRTNHERVLFFVPEHLTELEKIRSSSPAAEVWAEVTIPRKGPPRPIRLGVKRDAELEPVPIN